MNELALFAGAGGGGILGGALLGWSTICAVELEPDVGRVAHGVASKMDRLKAIGNGQVPLVAATAFLKLANILNHTTNS